jgi:Integrase core domain
VAWARNNKSRTPASRSNLRFLRYDSDGKFGQLGRPFPVENAGKKVSSRPAYDVWQMDIRGIPIPYGAPNAAAHIERLMGTICWERLDRMLIWNERHLRWVLKEFIGWYNHGRLHQGLNGLAEPKPSRGRLVAIPVLNGLHDDYQLSCHRLGF